MIRHKAKSIVCVALLALLSGLAAGCHYTERHHHHHHRRSYYDSHRDRYDRYYDRHRHWHYGRYYDSRYAWRHRDRDWYND
jgi:hypothetical protein